MKKFALAAVAAAGLAFSTSAQAADLVVYDDDLPMMTDTGMVEADWEGFYIGGSAGFITNANAPTLGGEIGVNYLAAENFLLGISGAGLIYLDGSMDTEFFVRGRAGVVFDSVALYATGGLGIYDFNLPLWDIGAGVEIMATDNVSLFAEGFLRQEIGFIPDVVHVHAGARFHFD